MDENRKLNHNSVVALGYVNLLVIPLSKSMVTVGCCIDPNLRRLYPPPAPLPDRRFQHQKTLVWLCGPFNCFLEDIQNQVQFIARMIRALRKKFLPP